MTSKLKKEFIKLLREDEEFRYTVAGLLGLEEILRRLDRIEEEQKKLREDFNSMLSEIKSINIRLGRLERTVEKITLDIEEEARAFIKHHLKQAGIEVELDVLKLPEKEINIYGANDEWCVIGEASLRAGKKLADELTQKYKLLKEKYPGYLRKNIILALYVTVPTPELIEEAKARGIWLLKATKEYVPLKKVLKKK